VFTLAWQSPKSGENPIISHILCLNPLGIATVGFAHLAMTQNTIRSLNYNLYFSLFYRKRVSVARGKMGLVKVT
jgi:hypothetical protein